MAPLPTLPDLVPGVSLTPTAAHSVSQWFNPAAFTANQPGETGTVGRNTLRGPGSWNVDMALTRKFSFKENQALELRAEGFNILNHDRYGNPVTSLTSSDFGRVRSALDPRILQFALKFVF